MVYLLQEVRSCHWRSAVFLRCLILKKNPSSWLPAIEMKSYPFSHSLLSFPCFSHKERNLPLGSGRWLRLIVLPQGCPFFMPQDMGTVGAGPLGLFTILLGPSSCYPSRWEFFCPYSSLCQESGQWKLWTQVRYLADFLAGCKGDSLARFSHCFFLLPFSSLWPWTQARPKPMKLRPWCLTAKIHWETKW